MKSYSIVVSVLGGVEQEAPTAALDSIYKPIFAAIIQIVVRVRCAQQPHSRAPNESVPQG